MKSLQDAVQVILTQPTPEALVDLHGALLVHGQPGEAMDCALEITGRFYDYLCELQSKFAARDYSELASRLDIGAVGTVALETMVAGEQDKFWERLLVGGLGEGLMVAASRQYVKAWEVEAGLTHTGTAWYLSEALWHASAQMQPDPSIGSGQSQSPEKRWQAIQALLAPASDPAVPASAKAVLLGRVFQILLLTYLVQILTAAV
jgi:hypothetical protein